MLTEKEKAMAMEWIGNRIKQAKSENKHQSSYCLKHILQHETGLYVENDEFKGLMCRCGYAPVNPSALNWTFRIRRVEESKKSYS